MKVLLLCLMVSAGVIFINTAKTAISYQEDTDNTHLNNNLSEVQCDSAALPVVLIHGFLASGDTWEKQALRFMANGICADRIFLFDWNSLGRARNAEILDEFIDRVLAKTGANRVNLVGHSAGGGLSYSYLDIPEFARKVSAYVHLGARPELSPPGIEGEVPTLNIYSEADPIVPGGDIEGAENMRLRDEDHYQVATSPMVFEAMYEFLYRKKPVITKIQSQTSEVVSIGGKSVTLGENRPNAGAEIAIYKLDPETGFRLEEEPENTAMVDSIGNWGPVNLSSAVPYEFEIIPANPDERRIFYFIKPFATDNPFVYLRAFPPPGSIASMMLSGLPEDDNQSAVVLFTAEQAVIHGRDKLSIEGIDLATADLADPTNSVISWFLYDENNNQQTDTTQIPQFASVPFLNGVDVFFDTSEEKSLNAQFNDSSIRFPNRKSGSEGIVVVVFN